MVAINGNSIAQQVEENRKGIRVKFGTAGIRGLFGRDVYLRETLAVCYAVNALIGEGVFGVGRDSRDSSMLLSTLATAAMNWYGSEVRDYGVIPTPVLAFNIKKANLHAGFSVTASHNPAEYSGIKVFGTDGIEFSLEAEHKLEELVRKSEGYIRRNGEPARFGATFEVTNAVQQYSESVYDSALKGRSKFKILVDCANGAASNVTPKILSMLGHHVVTVNTHPSSKFPGRLPEPLPETLREVGELVRLSGSDFGVAHDGDADRLVMIRRDGRVVPDYAISVLVLNMILRKVKRGTVVMSYNTSDALEVAAKAAGCNVTRSRLGKTFQELYDKRGIFACEPSKMVDPMWGYWEDGIYFSIMIVQNLSESSSSLDEALKEIPKYYNLMSNLTVQKAMNYDCIKEEAVKEFGSSIESVEDVDGIKVRLRNGDGWLMLRVSGTEKKVRVYSESRTESKARALLQKGNTILSKLL